MKTVFEQKETWSIFFTEGLVVYITWDKVIESLKEENNHKAASPGVANVEVFQHITYLHVALLLKTRPFLTHLRALQHL